MCDILQREFVADGVSGVIRSRSRSTVAYVGPPLGALRVSGGLLEFLSDADHQALLLEGA
jgi:hypothetical protein